VANFSTDPSTLAAHRGQEGKSECVRHQRHSILELSRPSSVEGLPPQAPTH
jgi:hypothetical protein